MLKSIYAFAACVLLTITLFFVWVDGKQREWCAPIGAVPYKNMCKKPDGSLWALRR